MKIPSSLRLSAVLLALLTSLCSPAAAAPNILVILVDDAGYADFGFQGGGINGDFADLTPNIDSIARTGVKFSNAHVAAAICCPSRAGLLTGRNPHRFGMEENIDDTPTGGLPVSEKTIADSLRALNYRTYAIGKWHLGQLTAESHPNRRGFDEFFGFLSGARNYGQLEGNNPADKIQRNGVYIVEQPDEYLTDLFGNEAVNYIDSHSRNYATKPFFMYLAFNAVHSPVQATPATLADPRIQDIAVPQRKTLAAMTISLDNAVGRVLAKLNERGLADNTMVVFLSDNGGPEDDPVVSPNWSDNGVLRGIKTDFWEGGIRVPFSLKWPAGLSRQLVGTTQADPVSSLDLLPTFVSLANGSLLPGQQTDGLNLVPRLSGQSLTPLQRTLFWRSKGSTGNQAAALIGNLKYVRYITSNQLYDLSTDLSEAHDLANSDPEDLARMQAAFAEWQTGVVEPLWGKGQPVISNPNLVRRSTQIGYEMEKTGSNYSYMIHDIAQPLSLRENWELEWSMNSLAVSGYQRNGSIVLSDQANAGRYIRISVNFDNGALGITELQNNSATSGTLPAPIPAGEIRDFRLSYTASDRTLVFRSGITTIAHALTANYKNGLLNFSGFGLNASTLTQFSPINRHIVPLVPVHVPSWSQMKEKRDYVAGTYDVNSQFLGGTELMSLVAHKGRLYAGVGYKNDLYFGAGSSDPFPGPQVLVKPAYNRGWQQDLAIGSDYQRIESLRSITFTTDKNGNSLPSPVTLLLAGCGELPTVPYMARAVVLIRNDATGAWTPTYPGSAATGSPIVRTLFDHRDSATGVQNLFAGYGVNSATVVRGGYNAATGLIDWESAAPELTGSGTIQSAGECNGVLYACINSDGIAGNNNGGIYWRQDGPSPRWNFVTEFPLIAGTNPAIHGFTAVPHPKGFDYDVALVTLESTGKVYALDPIGGDPRNGHLITEDLDLNEFLGDVLQKGERVSYPVVSAYNDMPEVVDPTSSEAVNLLGLGIQVPPEDTTSLSNVTSYLTRHPNRTYEYGSVQDPALAARLKAVRALVVSPFAEDQGKVLYLGGYDATLPGTPTWHNTAWIYRATFSKK